MSSSNEATVLVGGTSAATDPRVWLCARCGGVLRARELLPDAPQTHSLEQCVDELRRALFAAHKRIAELEGREEL